MSNDNTVNIIDPVTNDAVDVPDHPANTTTAEELRRHHDEAQQAHDDAPADANYLPADPLDYPERFSYAMGDELPVLVESSMRADPCEGVQGSYTEIVERDCDVCGYDRADHSAHTLAGVHSVECRACGNIIERA